MALKRCVPSVQKVYTPFQLITYRRVGVVLVDLKQCVHNQVKDARFSDIEDSDGGLSGLEVNILNDPWTIRLVLVKEVGIVHST